MNKHDQADAPEGFDPARLLRQLERHHRVATTADRNARVELYHRASSSMRVTLDGTQRSGCDDGLAVRIASAGGTAGFGVSGGGGGAALERALDAARRGMAPAADAGWPTGGRTLTDHDAPGVPSPKQLEEWLDEAHSYLSNASKTEKNRGDQGWVEVVRTVESWVGDGGFRASRTRTRAWALAYLPARHSPVASGRRPLVVAARSWDALDPAGWAVQAEARAARPNAPADCRHVLFTAEAAGLLVSSLARALHAEERNQGLPVGPGWRVEDHPLHPQALSGGTFDDAGFETRPLVLADGARIVGTIRGRGHCRRPSFRDPPRSSASHLVLLPGDEGHAPGPVVSGLAVHPLDGGHWILEVEGVLRPAGERATVANGFIPTSPRGLVERCIGTWGAVTASHRDVQTPGLVFRDLQIRA